MELATLNSRNTVAVEEALKEMTAAILDQEQRIDGLTNTIGTLANRMNFLESLVTTQKAETMGHGPSVL